MTLGIADVYGALWGHRLERMGLAARLVQLGTAPPGPAEAR